MASCVLTGKECYQCLGRNTYRVIWREILKWQNWAPRYQCTVYKMHPCTVQTLRLCTGRTTHRGSRGIALLFLDHGTLVGGERSASRPGRFLPPGKTRCPLYRTLDGPPGPVWTGEENLTPTCIRSLDHPACIYMDWTIPNLALGILTTFRWVQTIFSVLTSSAFYTYASFLSRYSLTLLFFGTWKQSGIISLCSAFHPVLALSWFQIFYSVFCCKVGRLAQSV